MYITANLEPSCYYLLCPLLHPKLPELSGRVMAQQGQDGGCTHILGNNHAHTCMHTWPLHGYTNVHAYPCIYPYTHSHHTCTHTHLHMLTHNHTQGPRALLWTLGGVDQPANWVTAVMSQGQVGTRSGVEDTFWISSVGLKL